MAQSKQLSYDALKSVIRHLDNDFRFKISTHIPAVKTAERAVPMKINTLRFDRNEFTIDGVSYDLGIICEGEHGERIHPDVHDQNESGGCKLELDKYGQEIGDSENTLLPGDFQVLEQINGAELPRNNYSYRLFYEPRTEKEELPSFKQFIQLKITRKGGKTSILRAPYDIKLYEAMKKLTRLFFGGRTTLQVRRFEIPELRRLVLRLPVGFRMKVDELSIGSDFLPSLQNSISPIFDQSSFPLKSLEIIKLTIPQPGLQDIFDQEILRKSQKLVFRWLCHVDHPNNSDFANISHGNFFVRNYYGSDRKLLLLINKWRKKYLPVGTLYCICTCDDTCQEVLRLVENRYGAMKINDKHLILPMTYTSELHISYEKNEQRTCTEQHQVLRIEVMDNPDPVVF